MIEAKEGRLHLSDTQGQNYGESISSNLSKADSQMQTAQAQFSQADSYQKQASYIQQNGLNIDQDLSKQYWDSLVKNFGVEKAKQIVSNSTINYEHIRQFSHAKSDQLRHQFEKMSPSSPFDIQDQYQSQSSLIQKSNNIEEIAAYHQSGMTSHAAEAGLTKPIGSNMQSVVEDSLKETQQKIIEGQKEIADGKQKLKKENPVHPDPANAINLHDLPPD